MKITLTSHHHTLSKIIAYHLIEAGHKLQLLSGTEVDSFWHEHMTVTPCDFQNSDTLKQALKGQDLALNLHAPLSLTEDSVSKSLNIFHGALQNDVRVIHFSNHEVYGVPLYVPINEHHPLMGNNHFTQTCIATDMLAKSFYQSFKMPVIVLRLFPIFGDQQLLNFLDQLHTKGSHAENQYFDFLRREDFKDALDALIASPVYSGEIFNLASGNLLSTRLLQKIYLPYAKKMSLDSSRAYTSEQLKTWNGRQGDNQALKNFTDWRVRHTTPEALKVWLRLYFSE